MYKPRKCLLRHKQQNWNSYYPCLISPMLAFITKGTPSQRALPMYNACSSKICGGQAVQFNINLVTRSIFIMAKNDIAWLQSADWPQNFDLKWMSFLSTWPLAIKFCCTHFHFWGSRLRKRIFISIKGLFRERWTRCPSSQKNI